MKIVVNHCYGGFSLSKEAYAYMTDKWDDEDDRTNSEFISLIEEWGSERVSGPYAKLKIIEIPDESTDWIMEETDGFEEILYVLDGKIYFA